MGHILGLSFFLAFSSLILITSSASTPRNLLFLDRGSSLHVEERNHVLVSPNGIFSAGFFSVGDNAFSFSVWFTSSPVPPIWMANRDHPTNGRESKLSLTRNGNLVLTDARGTILWSSDTKSTASMQQLRILNTGNLVLQSVQDGGTVVLWQSFDSPTDTLLPHQPLTRNVQLISSRSRGNYSSGFYRLYFDNDNVLRLLYDGSLISSIYWHETWLLGYQAGRTTYNSSRIAVLDSSGHFSSSDNFKFTSTDSGVGPLRRLTMDFDGNLRLYSLVELGSNKSNSKEWDVTYEVFSDPCKVHGLCGPNSLCNYEQDGRRCSCLPGFTRRNDTDWSYGCEPEFTLSCKASESGFALLDNVEFFGYDYANDYANDITGTNLSECQDRCLNLCTCVGVQFNFDSANGFFRCYPKLQLLNGYRSSSFDGQVYLKLPRATLDTYVEPSVEESKLNCISGQALQLDRTYVKKGQNELLMLLIWVACGIGGVELMVIALVMFFVFMIDGWDELDAIEKGYLVTATGFRKFTYSELKKATKGFSEEIGRGGGGVVYKGTFPDGRVAAIKRLNEAKQGEAEFLAEVSTIGKLNHMNLIEMWGYCAQGKHRLLVYEYMERGTLADNLSSVNPLSWEQRFEIAVGIAKSLAYIHEECLEWILHCDIKPHNILLDANYQPKVADFGLSKLLNRGDLNNFSRIRGTRGYMAPEWVFNLPITSKVDVYSYGIVVLEMVTGKNPGGVSTNGGGGGTMEHARLASLVKEKMNEGGRMEEWMKEIVDPAMGGDKYDVDQLETLVKVALKCSEEDRDARPTMSQVVEMLLSHDKG